MSLHMPNPPHVLSVDAGLLDAMDLFFSTITTATSATTATWLLLQR